MDRRGNERGKRGEERKAIERRVGVVIEMCGRTGQ